MGSHITILSIFVSWVLLQFEYFAASLSKEELHMLRGHVLFFDISGFRRSHHVFSVRARSCCFSLDELFGITR